MALKDPYCTLAEADSYLDGHSDWESAEDETKQTALFWGRIYIDSKYRCPDLDETDPSDNIKYANALLAEDYIQGNLLRSDGSKDPVVAKKRVKAGSVETEKSFLGGQKINYQQDVDALLSGECTKFNSVVLITRN